MSDQDIIDLGKQITAFGAAQQTKIDQLDAAKDSANSAAAAALAVQDVGRRTRIYVDPINGNDTNDGALVARSVKTWAGACALLRAGFAAEFFISSDLDVDESITLNAPPSGILFRGVNGGEKYIIKDATNHATYPGGLNCAGDLVVQTFEADFVMAHSRDVISPINVAGHLVARCNTTAISRTGTGSPLFDSSSAHYEVVNTVIDLSASGHVIAGVTSGADPNALNGISANFTQA